MVFYLPDGSPTPHPTDRQTAERLQSLKFDDGRICPDCGECSIKYTQTGRCIHCARLAALHFYNGAVLGVVPPSGLAVSDEMRQAVAAYPGSDYFPHPDSPERAAVMRSPVWARVEPCSRGGHLGLRRLEDGACYFCQAAGHAGPGPSPRQQAIAAGQSTYIPAEPCPKCGQAAPRRVDNGRCSGCHPTNGPRVDEAARAMMDSQPDLILDRADAQALGLSVFRTGRPCKRGHTGYRYTSTGGCIDCKRSAP